MNSICSPTSSEVGSNIRKLRSLKGWKQEILAEKLGISKVAVSNLERGIVDLPLSRLCALSEVFSINIKILFQEISVESL